MATRTVFGIMKTHAQADSLVTELTASGFLRENISILLPDQAKKQATRLDIGARATEHAQTETNAPEGAAIGASAGTAVGGALGLLAGLGALAIPGVGLFLAAGPILATLGGLSVGAAVGSVTGGLVGYGIPEHHARKFEELVQSGSILVAAHCDSSTEQLRATQVFARAEATNIVSSVEPSPATRHVDKAAAPQI